MPTQHLYSEVQRPVRASPCFKTRCAANSLARQPQERVLPLLNCLPSMTASFPQSHSHNHREYLNLRSNHREITTRRPKRCPVNCFEKRCEADSRERHPQELVLPNNKLPRLATLFFPQSHRHSQCETLSL